MCRVRQFKLSGRLRSQGLIGYGILSSSLPSNVTRGRVAELADALDLGSSVAIRGGSSPLSPTIYVSRKSETMTENTISSFPINIRSEKSFFVWPACSCIILLLLLRWAQLNISLSYQLFHF